MSDATRALTTSTGAVPVLSPDDIKRLERAFPLIESRGGGVEELARAAGVSVEVAQRAMDDPAAAALLQDAHEKAEDAGSLLKPVAARLTLAMLAKLSDEVAAGNLDADDIGNLLPKVHRVVEHADRIEAGRGDGYDNLPVFQLTFINGAMHATVDPPAAEVIDIDAPEVQE